MKQLLFTFLSLGIVFISCNRVKTETKETLNKGGEVVGKTAAEFFEGVTEGVDKTLQCEIILAPALSDKGLQTGKFSINNDTSGGQNNLLSIYFIFEKEFKDTISIKAFDKSELEVGKTSMYVNGKAGEAKYFDFHFDQRTYIEARSKINIE